MLAFQGWGAGLKSSTKESLIAITVVLAGRLNTAR